MNDQVVKAIEGLLPRAWRNGLMDHMPGVKDARLALREARRQRDRYVHIRKTSLRGLTLWLECKRQELAGGLEWKPYTKLVRRRLKAEIAMLDRWIAELRAQLPKSTDKP